MEFMYPVFTRMPAGVTIRDSGLCCCVPCLMSAITSLCLLIHQCTSIFPIVSTHLASFSNIKTTKKPFAPSPCPLTHQPKKFCQAPSQKERETMVWAVGMGKGERNPPAARRGRTLLFAPGGVPGGTGRSGGTPPAPAPPPSLSGHHQPPLPTHPARAPRWRCLWPWWTWPRDGGGDVGGGGGGGDGGGGGGTSDAVGACATCTVGRCGDPEAIYWGPPTNQTPGHSQQHSEKENN